MKNKKLVIIIVIFLVLLIISAAAFFILKDQWGAAAPKKAEKKYSYFYTPGAAFVSNVQDSEALVKISIVLEINEPKQEDFLAGEIAVIRDLILNTIRECDEDVIRKPDVQQQLSDTICKRLNERYDVDFFVRAYFTDIVVQ